MDSSVSLKDENWFLRVCQRISNAVYVAAVTLRISLSLVLSLSPLLRWQVKLVIRVRAAGWEPVEAHTAVCSRDEL